MRRNSLLLSTRRRKRGDGGGKMRRVHEGENPLSATSLAAETERGSDSLTLLPQRLERYAKAKSRALAMRDYIASVPHQTTDSQKVAHRLHECGAYLVFRHYMT